MEARFQETEKGSAIAAPSKANPKTIVRGNSKTTGEAEQEHQVLKEQPAGNAESIRNQLSLQLIAQTIASDRPNGLTAEYWVSQIADVFNYLLGRIGLPIELRAYVIALIGASEGQTDWFECSDRELAVRLLGDAADGKTVSALKKQVQRYRAK